MKSAPLDVYIVLLIFSAKTSQEIWVNLQKDLDRVMIWFTWNRSHLKKQNHFNNNKMYAKLSRRLRIICSSIR